MNDQIPMANDEDADAAWTHILAYVAEHRASLDAGAPVEILVEADALIEAFIDRHADAFVERIEEQAAKDLTFARLVEGVHTGDMAGPGVEQIRLLQDALFERGDVGWRWQGWAPVSSEQLRQDDP